MSTDLALITFVPGPKLNQRTAVYGFGSGADANPKEAIGIDKLCQEVIIWLRTTKGSDIFNIAAGGNMNKVVGLSMTNAALKSIVSDIGASVSDVEKQIIAAQANAPNLTIDDRLVSLRVKDVVFIKVLTALYLSMTVTNARGQSRNIGVTL